MPAGAHAPVLGGAGGRLWVAAALAGAAAVGVLTTLEPALAAALVAAAAVALVVAVDVKALPVFLIFTMFVESLSLGPGLRIGRVAGALALAVIAYRLLTAGRAGLRPNALLLAAGAYGVWILASALWADDSGAVISTLSSYLLAIAYMLAFALLVREESQWRAIAGTLAFGSLVFGLVSFATYASTGAGETRAAGLQGDPNYFAVYQVVALAPALALAAVERRPLVRLGLYGVVGVIVLSVVSSLSRTGLLALAGVVLATLVVPWRTFFARPGQKAAYALSLAAAAAVAVGVAATAVLSRVQEALEPDAGDRGSGRIDLWRAAWRGFREEPLLGLGAGNFRSQSLDLLQTTPGVDASRNYVRAGREAHNAYLGNLTDLGLIGFALFASVIVLAAVYLLRSTRRARAAGRPVLERFSIAFAVSLFGFALSAVFLSNELGKPLWILVGLALALDVESRRPGRARAPDYDPATVGEDFGERLERRLDDRVEALLAEQERLDRRRAALAAREQELAERERRLAGREAPERLDEREADLAGREKDLEARARVLRELQRAQAAGPPPAQEEGRGQKLEEAERRLAARSAELEARERSLAEQAERLAARERELGELRVELDRLRVELEARQREAAAAAAAPPAAPEPEPEPEPEPVAATQPPGESGRYTLPELEGLVDGQAGKQPERAEEWRYYLVYLRDFAAADGTLPANFDALVEEVFGDALRAGRR